jgi:hypothetical protein
MEHFQFCLTKSFRHLHAVGQRSITIVAIVAVRQRKSFHRKFVVLYIENKSCQMKTYHRKLADLQPANIIVHLTSKVRPFFIP